MQFIYHRQVIQNLNRATAGKAFLLALLIWGSLRLTKYLQTRMVGPQGAGQSLELIETSLLAPGLKLAVVRFHDREILLGCSRNGFVPLGEADARSRAETTEAGQD